MWWIEAIGIVATLFVLSSFICSKVAWIRRINMIGSAIFVVYGFLMGAISVWLLNGIMIFVNGYKLYKDWKVNNDKRMDA